MHSFSSRSLAVIACVLRLVDDEEVEEADVVIVPELAVTVKVWVTVVTEQTQDDDVELVTDVEYVSLFIGLRGSPDARLSSSTQPSSSTSSTSTSSSTASSTPAASASTYTYQGCWTEASGVRTLSGTVFYNNALTVEICAVDCAGAGYSLFGVEYSRECWCGNTIAAGSQQVSDTECTMTCDGNTNEICGGADLLNIYSLPTTTSYSGPTTVPSVGNCVFIGCYTEATNSRALISSTFTDYTATGMTVEKCAAFCSSYVLFGVEFRGECYCGNALQAGSVQTDDAQCSMACDGNNAETCGGSSVLDLYSCSSSSTSSSASSSRSSSTSSSTSSSRSSSTSSSTSSSRSSSTSSPTSSSRSSSTSSSTSSSRSSSTSSSTSTSRSSSTSTSRSSSTSSSTSSSSTSSTSATSSTCLPSPTIINGDFEDGVLSPWSWTGSSGSSASITTPAVNTGVDGNYVASINLVPGSDATSDSLTLTTTIGNICQAGVSIRVTFDYYCPTFAFYSEYVLSIDGNEIFGSSCLITGWTRGAMAVALSSGPTATISFLFSDTGEYISPYSWQLDNVSAEVGGYP